MECVIDHIKQMHSGGASIRSIAKCFHRAPSTISTWLKKPEISVERNLITGDDLNTKAIVGLYQEGLSSAQIAEKLSASKSTIEYRLKKVGVSRTNTDGIRLAIDDGRMKTPVPKGTKGHRHPTWKGGKFQRVSGYVYVYCPEHPRAESGRYVPEHILVWEKYHGKSVPEGFHVHHLNGIKNDNRPENLAALDVKDHNQRHFLCKKRIQELEQENAFLKRGIVAPNYN